jgi:hypothetical protein
MRTRTCWSPQTPTLLEGYGSGGFAVTTAVPEAQAFFSNGMELGAAFAHSAAVAAMEQSVRLDPACAMCKWGQALVAGPTINFGKDKAERKPLYALAREAQRQARAAGSERERALTDALVQRYRPGGRRSATKPMPKAMQAVQARWPEDNEIAVLTADAMMVAAFDDERRSSRRALLARAIRCSRRARARSGAHPGDPFLHPCNRSARRAGQGRAYADRLEALAPRASHLVHMPAHTWYWLGRYEDAARTNLRAVELGKDNAARLGLPAPDGVWGLPYHAHNVIYGIGGALMAGDAEVGLALARPLVERAATREATAGLAAARGARLRSDRPVRSRRGRRRCPSPRLPYLKAAWHYARGEAAASAGDAAAVRAEMEQIPERIAGDDDDRSQAARADARDHPQRARRAAGDARGRSAGRGRVLPPGSGHRGDALVQRVHRSAGVLVPGAPRRRRRAACGQRCRGGEGRGRGVAQAAASRIRWRRRCWRRRRRSSTRGIRRGAGTAAGVTAR